MSFEVGPLPPVQPGVAPQRAARAPAGAGFAAQLARADRTLVSVPAAPPAEVQAEVDAAAERAAQLWRDDRELNFRRDESTGRIVIEVRDREGNAIRTIPPSHALSVMAGASL
jgi:hypothetical protein